MLELPNEAKILCSNCKSIFFVSGSDILVEAISSEERGMGPETIYSGGLDVRCPNCESDIDIRYDASEYPIGAFNFSEIHVTGGELVEGFGDIDFAFDEEIYSFDEETNLYIPEEKKIITNLNQGVIELMDKASADPNILFGIAPRKFEELIAFIFERHGFEVQLTKKTRDGGRDIIAIRSDLDIRSKYLIECKRYAKNRPVGVDLVRNLYGVQVGEGANKSILATTSHFSPDAKEFARKTNTTEWAMDLKDHDDILKWIQASKSS